jgi:hypothetical protein
LGDTSSLSGEEELIPTSAQPSSSSHQDESFTFVPEEYGISMNEPRNLVSSQQSIPNESPALAQIQRRPVRRRLAQKPSEDVKNLVQEKQLEILEKQGRVLDAQHQAASMQRTYYYLKSKKIGEEMGISPVEMTEIYDGFL